MHFEILIEDQSGKMAMEILAPKLLGDNATFRIHAYKGAGHIPSGLKPNSDANKRILLDRLPRLLQGYGKSNLGTVVVICDLDNKDEDQFLAELISVLNNCSEKPEVLFCLAIEEFEAWYLGDLNAIQKAYPRAKNDVLRNYVNDSICGTWELLADAIYSGGHKKLSKNGWQAIGKQKSEWAKAISPHMDIDNNVSPSFRSMGTRLQAICKPLGN